MRVLSSIAQGLRMVLPRNALGWTVVVSFATLTGIHLLGQYRAKLGSFLVPEVSAWWLVLLGVVAFLFAPRPIIPVKSIRLTGTLMILGLLVWPLSGLHERLSQPSSTMTVLVHRASRGLASDKRTVRLDSLSLDSRRTLNRLAGRRRDVKLDISGYLLVTKTGTYRFEASCDDRCVIELDQRTVLKQAGSGKIDVPLEKGLHRLSILYRQRTGPAHFRISWNRPSFFELLPLEHFVGSRPEALTSGSVLLKHFQVAVVLVVSMVLWFLICCVLVCLGGQLRTLFVLKVVTPALEISRTAANATPAAVAPPRPTWAIGVFALALAVRVGFVLISDQPLLYGHQYNYFTNALRIVEHPHPIDYILTSDAWRDWLGWTIAPLYHLFVAAMFKIAGPDLLVLRLAQCVLDAGVALAVASLGRQLAGALGTWAGIGYAVYWPAIEMTSYTMTENLHTLLLVSSFALIAKEAERPGIAGAFAGGFVLGLSALARAVSSAFLGVVALWRISLRGLSLTQLKRNGLLAALILLGGATAILPWTARNVFLIGDPVLIESVAFVNLLEDTWVGSRESMIKKERSLARLRDPAEKQAAVTELALRHVRERPDLFLRKTPKNFWHFLRPEGLHYALRVERPHTKWENVVAVLLGDVPFAASVALFVTFALAGRPSPTRRLLLLWSAYYLILLIVVFHVEVRYRSGIVPFFFAGAIGGVSTLSLARRNIRTWAAFGLGLWLCLATLLPYMGAAWRATVASFALRPAAALVERGELGEAERIVRSAAAKHPTSPRPWFQYGRWLASHGFAEKAIEAYREGGKISALRWIPTVVRPQLLREAGYLEESRRATDAANSLSWGVDPWIMLETAWRELPPPRTDEILLARGDYGSVRGFLHPRGTGFAGPETRAWWFRKTAQGHVPPGAHRWSRSRAWLRLFPTQEASGYLVTIEMGSPYPSPHPNPEVILRCNDGEPKQFKLGPEIRPYTISARVPPGEPILIRLDTPTWSRAGEPADQGVRVDRVTVSPVPSDRPN